MRATTAPTTGPGRSHRVSHDVLGPWSLATSRQFWEGFAPAELAGQGADDRLRTVFRVDADWSVAQTAVTQDGATAVVEVVGDGDLDAAASQVCRFLSLDVDARAWPAVGDRDEVIADAHWRLPGLRPCGFRSPYEAWTPRCASDTARTPDSPMWPTDGVRSAPGQPCICGLCVSGAPVRSPADAIDRASRDPWVCGCVRRRPASRSSDGRR